MGKKKAEQQYLIMTGNEYDNNEVVNETDLLPTLNDYFKEYDEDKVIFLDEVSVYRIEKLKLTVKQQKTEIRVI